MKDRRTILLMLVLLAMLGLFLFKTVIQAPAPTVQASAPAAQALLPRENEIRDVTITQGDDGYFYATIAYFYRGGMTKPEIRVQPDSPAQTIKHWVVDGQIRAIEPGEHTVRIEVIRPPEPTTPFASSKITVSLYNGLTFNTVSASKEIAFQNAWPDAATYSQNRYVAKMGVEQLHSEAMALIDQGEDFTMAKRYLERLVSKDPGYVPAYVELARHAMKTNWGPEGLKQAENYLKTGLALQPNDASTQILLGYVYTHQGRYELAKTEFQAAEKSGSAHLNWLWTHWGEFYALQDQPDIAVEYYLKALAGGRLYNNYDRARLDAYRHLFVLLNNQAGYANAQALYLQRADEYPDQPCFRSDYAAFEIARNDNYQIALTQSRQALDNGCAAPEGRRVSGLANYLAWLKAPEDQKAAYLVQAQLFFPESPALLYALATNDATAAVLNELKKRAVSVDIKDNRNFNALAYALIENNVAAARQLLKLGAKLNETVGEQDYPVAMTPIFYQHVEGVQLLIDQGVNWSAIKFRGETAVDYAEKTQNNDIIRLVKKIKT